MEAILQVEHLTKRYPDFTLDDVSFSLPKGEVMGLIGENGAGKSTTIHALLDLIRRDAGNVTFWGQALSASKPLREDIGVVLDGVNFYETLTPEQVGKVCRAAYRPVGRGSVPRLPCALCPAPAQGDQGALQGDAHEAADRRGPLPPAQAPDPGRGDQRPGPRHAGRDAGGVLGLCAGRRALDPDVLAHHDGPGADRRPHHLLHRGKLLFCKPKDELLDRYGILRCGAADFAKIDKADILACRREDYQWSVLVADKEAARRKYRPQVLDDATIDDILLLYVKGEQNR